MEAITCPYNDLFRIGGESDDGCFTNEGLQLLNKLSNSLRSIRQQSATKERRGSVTLFTDEQGELFEIRNSRGYSFTKNFDGTWTERFEIDSFKSETSVRNVCVDRQGNISYDYLDIAQNISIHYERHSAGSFSYVDEDGKFVYDAQGRLVQAPCADGGTRRFEYDDFGGVTKVESE